MQLLGVFAVLAGLAPWSNAELQIGGVPLSKAEIQIGDPSKPAGDLGSMAWRLKEAATRSFLRTRDSHDQDQDDSAHEETHEDHEDDEESAHEDMHEDQKDSAHDDDDDHHDSNDEENEEDTSVAEFNSSDIWAYERENDDGTVLNGTDPFENKSLTELMMEDSSDDEASYEQEEEEIPEEWTDPTNSTDEWAYEKAHDDGTVLNGTNPLEAPGFVWEGDERSEEGEASDDEQEDEPENEVSKGNMSAIAHAYDSQKDEWQDGEEIDDGTVLYGTNPLDHEDDDEDDDEPDHALVKVNSTHDEEEEDPDDGTVDYGTNPMDMPDDEDSDEQSDEEDYDMHRGNSSHTDDEEEEYDDGTVLYGTNPLEESDQEEEYPEDESSHADAKNRSDVKMLAAPASASQDTNETTV